MTAGRASWVIALRNESAGRRPARVYVGKIERIELGPENVALRAQCGVRLILLLARARMLCDPRERKLSVFRRLCQPARAVIKTAGEPWITLATAVHAQND